MTIPFLFLFLLCSVPVTVEVRCRAGGRLTAGGLTGDERLWKVNIGSGGGKQCS